MCSLPLNMYLLDTEQGQFPQGAQSYLQGRRQNQRFQFRNSYRCSLLLDMCRPDTEQGPYQ